MRIISILTIVFALLVGTGAQAQTTAAPTVKFGATTVISGTISVQTVQALANSGITIFPVPPLQLKPKGFRISAKVAGGKDEISFDSENGNVTSSMKAFLMKLKAGDMVTLTEVSYTFNGENNMAPMVFTIK